MRHFLKLNFLKSFHAKLTLKSEKNLQKGIVF